MRRWKPISWVVMGIAVLLVYWMFPRRVASNGGSTADAAAEDRSQIPEWVPIYPGSKPFRVSTLGPPQERYIDFAFRTGDSCRQVIDFYVRKLEQQQFSIRPRMDTSSSFGCEERARATSADGGRELNISASRQGNAVEASIRVIERKSSKPAGASDPLTFFQWIPLPPGTSASQVRPEKSTNESKLQFHATTSSDCRKVIDWYRETFPTVRFAVTSVKNGDQNGMVQAEDAARKRSVTVTVTSSGRTSELDIVAIERR